MRRLPDALVVVDAQYEDTAIREAKRLEIPASQLLIRTQIQIKLIILFLLMMTR